MSAKNLKISAIPAFSDNYIWLLRGAGPACAVVDPGEHEPVLKVLDEQGLELKYILLTHHHWDHSGGIAALLEHHDAKVWGPADERLEDWNMPCKEGERVVLEDLGLEFGILDIPAHTRSHIAFHGPADDRYLLFSGDTLFSIGCGRLFEGSPEQMLQAMDKLAELPPETLVYCGHEYTRSNCAFALEVEPGNAALQDRAAEVEQLRANGEITLPSTLGMEIAANPFMRCREPSVVQGAQKFDPEAAPGTSTMAAIRAWKDSF